MSPLYSHDTSRAHNDTTPNEQVNNFVVNTTKFLNRFSGECELKLVDVSNRITSTQTLLCVLECKLR